MEFLSFSSISSKDCLNPLLSVQMDFGVCFIFLWGVHCTCKASVLFPAVALALALANFWFPTLGFILCLAHPRFPETSSLQYLIHRRSVRLSHVSLKIVDRFYHLNIHFLCICCTETAPVVGVTLTLVSWLCGLPALKREAFRFGCLSISVQIPCSCLLSCIFYFAYHLVRGLF